MNRKELQSIINFAKKYELMNNTVMDVYITYKRSFVENIMIN